MAADLSLGILMDLGKTTGGDITPLFGLFPAGNMCAPGNQAKQIPSPLYVVENMGTCRLK